MNELLRKAREIQEAYNHLRATGQGLKANLPAHTGLAYRTCCRYLRLLEYAEEESDPDRLRQYWQMLQGKGAAAHATPATPHATPFETPNEALDFARGVLFRTVDVLCLMSMGAFMWELLKLLAH